MRKLKNLIRFRHFEKFSQDVKHGKLADYSWIDPRYYPTSSTPANDQHPDHSVAEGEKLIKHVYETLRSSQYWNETLLIITYDEHGGFYDHYPTPLNVPNPDGRIATNPPFNFTRLGIRIPTIMISPWINKGILVKRPDGPNETSEYTHTSIAATLKK